jgi:hypothetical protein
MQVLDTVYVYDAWHLQQALLGVVALQPAVTQWRRADVARDMLLLSVLPRVVAGWTHL